MKPSNRGMNTLISVLILLVLATPAPSLGAPDGSKRHPLRVLMVPADTGTNDITQDYKPIFSEITRQYGIHFDIKAGNNYSAVVAGICNNQVDIAWFGASTFGEAHAKCGAQLLAVDVLNGESVYYSGLFVARNSDIADVQHMRGKRIAFGSINSTSSFNVPVAMLLSADIDPAKDFKKIILTESHSASLAALAENKVDVAAASFNSYQKAVKKGAIDPEKFKPLIKSEPLPNPPLATRKDLPPDLREKLRTAFNEIHTKMDANKIRGYGGARVDRYDANFDERHIFRVLEKLASVTKQVKEEIITKASER